jgi:hypothetical protein
LKLDIVFRKTTSHAESSFPISANVLANALKSDSKYQKTKCQKNFHHQKLRQKIRLKCENYIKGEELLPTNGDNSGWPNRCYYPKARKTITVKAIPVMIRDNIFPFISR